MSLKTFTGFRGVAALAEVGGIQFVIIASTPKQLETIYRSLMPACEFDPARCQKSIMIQAETLPAKKSTQNKEEPNAKTDHQS
jgi:hypothetical protein